MISKETSRLKFRYDTIRSDCIYCLEFFFVFPIAILGAGFKRGSLALFVVV